MRVRPILLGALSVVLFSRPVSATPVSINLRCVSNPPTTSFIISTRGDTVSLRMLQHNGTRYMPIFSGIITPSDFPYLKQKADLLTRIPEDMTFSWPAKSCKDFGENIYFCKNGPSMEIGGVKIDSYDFTTARMSKKIFDFEIDWYQINFGIRVDSRHHEVPMDFAYDFCSFQR